MTAEQIARVAHAANREFDAFNLSGEYIFKSWDEEQPLVRAAFVKGVQNFLEDPLKPLRGGSQVDIDRERLFRAIIRALHDDVSLPRF